MEKAENNTSGTNFKVFVLAMTIVASCLAGLFGLYMAVKSEISVYNTKFSTDLGDMRGDVKAIKTDITWIKSTLKGAEITR